MPELTTKERWFAEFYSGAYPWLPKGNAVDAARRAGYKWPSKQGYQVLSRARVRRAIEDGVPVPTGRKRTPRPLARSLQCGFTWDGRVMHRY